VWRFLAGLVALTPASVYRYVYTFTHDEGINIMATTFPHSSHNSAQTRALAHGVDLALLSESCPVEQGRDHCHVCQAVSTDDPAPLDAPQQYWLSEVRTTVYQTRSISYVHVLKNSPYGGVCASFWPEQHLNALYAYRWDCDIRWTVVDKHRTDTVLVESESEARQLLLDALAARGLI